MPRPSGIDDPLNPPPDDRPVREPGTTFDGKTFAERLLAKRPPGEAVDPRKFGKWRPA